ncbi:3-oxoadipate enol-lactone hydrolase [Haladaptatus paucihalophilus DX253]|uniref:3-oxoadipate enol-lactone hydrolase n=1 Tax=Haladaptatus paucihalophilus DX253 TaxID=797209 RepID=E7QPT4_HALPU|nr:alpha/beta hydrolase [Haladaptatus paucihalophilus]EFW93537.1 3-oxoadipate enol-lactone hydrolase [Haladaptatus paucihalophilus DX253]SHL21711.1 Pimeloyl-ACP methyl ester carboxylesterase [Haladaptatus paucihalophilus DX253]
MPFTDNDGVSLYYEEHGPTDADPIVFVEGLGYGRWMWRWQREAFADDYRVIVWDNRGTGDSDAPDGPYSIEEMAGDLEAVLAAVGVESVHVVGASMGGMIAQQYALDYNRAQTLSLLCTTPGGDEGVPTPPETQERMFDVPEGCDEREAIRYKMAPAMTEEFAAEHDDLLSDIVDWRLAGDASDEARGAQAMGVTNFDASDRLGELSLPTLIAHGTADSVLPFENAELLADRIPHAELEPFEGGPHLFFIEQSGAVNERLRTFLDDA